MGAVGLWRGLVGGGPCTVRCVLCGHPPSPRLEGFSEEAAMRRGPTEVVAPSQAGARLGGGGAHSAGEAVSPALLQAGGAPAPPPTVLPSLGHRRPAFPQRLRPCPSGPLCGGVGMWGGAPNPHPEAPAPLRGAIELLLGPRQGGAPEQYSQSWGPDGALGRSCEGRAPWAGGGADPGLLSRPQLAKIGEGGSSRGMTRGAVRRARAPRLAAPRAGLVWGAPLGSRCLPPRGAVTEGPARACSRCP